MMRIGSLSLNVPDAAPPLAYVINFSDRLSIDPEGDDV